MFLLKQCNLLDIEAVVFRVRVQACPGAAHVHEAHHLEVFGKVALDGFAHEGFKHRDTQLGVGQAKAEKLQDIWLLLAGRIYHNTASIGNWYPVD